MNNIDYKDVIKRNYHGEYGTFAGELHEHETFEKDLYDEFCEAIKRYTEKTKNAKTIDREYSWYITFPYLFFLIESACHFDPANGYKIKNITDEFLIDETWKIEEIVKKYFVGNADIPNSKKYNLQTLALRKARTIKIRGDFYMNNIDYKDVIKRNYHGEYGTFLGELHESAVFEKQLYDELCEAIKRYTEETKESIYKIDREYSWYITFIYSHFLIEQSAHSDPADGHKIKNITDEFLIDVIWELRAIVKKYFVGNADIPNP